MSWNEAVRTLVKNVEGDIFALMDCCFASNFYVGSILDPSRIFEIIAASGVDQATPGPGKHSFTRALIESLEALAAQFKDSFFSTRDLREKIHVKRPNTPPALWCATLNSRHIRLSPIKDGRQNRVAGPIKETPRGLLSPLDNNPTKRRRSSLLGPPKVAASVVAQSNQELLNSLSPMESSERRLDIRPTETFPVDWSDSDDVSNPGSVFSIGQSSVTSQTSIVSDGISTTAVDQFVSLLLGHERLNTLCVEAIRSNAIGPERFERNFRRLLKIYASDLRQEATKTRAEQRAAAELVLRRARYTAAKVRQSCDDQFKAYSLKIPNEPEDTALQIEEYLKGLDMAEKAADELLDAISSGSSDGEQSSDSEEHERLAYLTSVKSFMTEGKAFDTFCINLANFVHPSWETKLKDFVISVSKRRNEYGMTERDSERFKRVVADIAGVKACSVAIHEHYEQSWVERAQCYMEKQTSSGWDWWPLKQPRYKIESRYRYINWTCVSAES